MAPTNASPPQPEPNHPSNALVAYHGQPIAPPIGRPVPPASSMMPDLPSLLKALRRRWALAVGLGLVVMTAAAVAAWFAVPPARYTARALLSVAAEQPSIIFKTGDRQVNFQTYQRTQLTLLKSRFVLLAALRDPKVAALPSIKTMDDPVRWLERQVNADYNGEVLSISMTGTQSSELATIVNAVVKAYINEVVEADAHERKRRFESLQRIYLDYQTKLNEKRKYLRSLAEEVGSSDKQTVRLTHEFALEQLAQAQRELMQTQHDLRKAEVELSVLSQSQSQATTSQASAASEAEVAEVAFVEMVRQDPQIAEYQAQLNALGQRLEDVRRVARNPRGEVSGQRLRANYDEVRQLYDDRLQQLREAFDARPPSSLDPDTAIGVLNRRVAVLKDLEEMLSEEVQNRMAQTKSINTSAMDLESLQDEIAHADTAAKRVGDEIEALKVELNAPPRVKQIEEADVPRKESDKRITLAGGSGIGALALVLLGVSWFEFRSRRIGAPEDVVQGLGMRLVGALPAIPDRAPHPHDTQEATWERLMIESIDAARTMLLYGPGDQSTQIMMITSAVSGEGKTSLSCHLATSLARAGRRTLLIDGDLRRPSIHHLLDLLEGPGFSELLRGEADFDEVIQPVPAAHFWTIPAGHPDSTAIELLAQDRLRRILDQLRQRFDNIVIDTAPVLPVADALLIGRHVDAAVHSVLQGVSRTPNIHAANARLYSLGIRSLGAVLAGTRVSQYGPEYHYYGAGPGFIESRQANEPRGGAPAR